MAPHKKIGRIGRASSSLTLVLFPDLPLQKQVFSHKHLWLHLLLKIQLKQFHRSVFCQKHVEVASHYLPVMQTVHKQHSISSILFTLQDYWNGNCLITYHVHWSWMHNIKDVNSERTFPVQRIILYILTLNHLAMGNITMCIRFLFA